MNLQLENKIKQLFPSVRIPHGTSSLFSSIQMTCPQLTHCRLLKTEINPSDHSILGTQEKTGKYQSKIANLTLNHFFFTTETSDTTQNSGMIYYRSNCTDVPSSWDQEVLRSHRVLQSVASQQGIVDTEMLLKIGCNTVPRHLKEHIC